MISIVSDILRAAACIAALISFYTGRESAGIFILVTVAVTLVFKIRGFVLLDRSSSADWWELNTTLLFFANAVLLVTGWYYYPRLTWVDIPMHFWGGLVAGIWAYLVFIKNRSYSFIEEVLIVLGIVALVGVGWEFFEWILDHILSRWYIFPRNQPSVDDVLGDLLMDLLGGVVGGFLMRHNLKNLRK